MTYYLKLAFTIVLFACLAVQCWEDIRNHLLYDEVSMLLAVTGFVRSFFFYNFHDSLAGAGLCFLVLAFFSLYKRGGMGLGDVLLGTSLGFWLGPEMSAVMLVIAFVVAFVVCSILWCIHSFDERGIAFAPFLTISMLAVYYFGHQIVELYGKIL